MIKRTQIQSRWAVRLAVAGAVALMSAGATAAQITLFEGPSLQGRSMATSEPLANLEHSPFRYAASSVVVTDGTWEVCTDTFYRGRCAQLIPGSYSLLGSQLNGRIASVRQVSYEPGPSRVVINPDVQTVASNSSPAVIINSGAAPVVIQPANPDTPQVVVHAPLVNAGPGPDNPRITLYHHTPQGVVRAVDLTTNVEDLDTRRFESRADSAFVSGGIWRLCDGERGRGNCADFSPGRYDNLGNLDRRVKSAYLLTANVTVPTPTATAPSGRAVLFEHPNFAGGSAVVEHGRAPDLDWANFKNPATSARIESGTWLMCSNIGYQGDCRILGPGNYPVLTGVIDRGIYSARQVDRPVYGAADSYWRY
jgi:hypothetical protein